MTKATTQQQPRTLAEVDALIDKAKALKSDVDARLPELEKQRRQALLDSDDAAVDKLEREIEIAKRDRERAIARMSVLDDERVDAIERDAQAEAQTLADRAERVRQAGVKLLTIDYPEVARVLAEMIRKLAGAEEVIRSTNRLVAGRVPDVESINHSAGRYEPDVMEEHIEKWWVFPLDWTYAGPRLISADGSACPPKPEKRPLDPNPDGTWNFEEPVLRERKVMVRIQPWQIGDDIETLIGLIPSPGLKEAPYWDPTQVERVRLDGEALADALLADYGKPAKTARASAAKE